mmetsp:Transcript_34894/g.61322  ORF Transcript_34894/g.61322 Transcript_34894/m.61322 type:complete len:239 (+) Transcript_34894:354-1070(+)
MLYLVARSDLTQANIVHNKPVKIPIITPSILALGENQLLRYREVSEGLEIIPSTAVGTFVDECGIFCRTCGVGNVKQRDLDSTTSCCRVYKLSNAKDEWNSVNFYRVQVGAKSWDLKLAQLFRLSRIRQIIYVEWIRPFKCHNICSGSNESHCHHALIRFAQMISLSHRYHFLSSVRFWHLKDKNLVCRSTFDSRPLPFRRNDSKVAVIQICGVLIKWTTSDFCIRKRLGGGATDIKA